MSGRPAGSPDPDIRIREDLPRPFDTRAAEATKRRRFARGKWVDLRPKDAVRIELRPDGTLSGFNGPGEKLAIHRKYWLDNFIRTAVSFRTGDRSIRSIGPDWADRAGPTASGRKMRSLLHCHN